MFLGVSAELYIAYNGDSIDFCNNERGFSDKDVRALCAVGQSTKDVKGGYIGEKGIGFKAGFTIANRIQVLLCATTYVGFINKPFLYCMCVCEISYQFV